jgi:hypothetical protein
MKAVYAVPPTTVGYSATKYFAVLGEYDRQGPFDSMSEAVGLLKRTSRDRGHNCEQAKHFFLHESALEQVDTVDGQMECFRVGWLAREESGRLPEFSPEKTIDLPPDDLIFLKQESDEVDCRAR